MAISPSKKEARVAEGEENAARGEKLGEALDKFGFGGK
jgi:hypothetical protein